MTTAATWRPTSASGARVVMGNLGRAPLLTDLGAEIDPQLQRRHPGVRVRLGPGDGSRANVDLGEVVIADLHGPDLHADLLGGASSSVSGRAGAGRRIIRLDGTSLHAPPGRPHRTMPRVAGPARGLRRFGKSEHCAMPLAKQRSRLENEAASTVLGRDRQFARGFARCLSSSRLPTTRSLTRFAASTVDSAMPSDISRAHPTIFPNVSSR